jgi:hypothetical protein
MSISIVNIHAQKWNKEISLSAFIHSPFNVNLSSYSFIQSDTVSSLVCYILTILKRKDLAVVHTRKYCMQYSAQGKLSIPILPMYVPAEDVKRE